MKNLDKLVSGIKFHLALKRPNKFFISSSNNLSGKIEFHNNAQTGDINCWDCIEEIYKTRDIKDLIQVEAELIKQFESDRRFVKIDNNLKLTLDVDSVYHIYILLAK